MSIHTFQSHRKSMLRIINLPGPKHNLPKAVSWMSKLHTRSLITDDNDTNAPSNVQRVTSSIQNPTHLPTQYWQLDISNFGPIVANFAPYGCKICNNRPEIQNGKLSILSCCDKITGKASLHAHQSLESETGTFSLHQMGNNTDEFFNITTGSSKTKFKQKTKRIN